MVNILKKYFGQRWFLTLLVILLYALWPIIVFFHQIKFDPALFVTNWINTTYSSLLIAILLKIYIDNIIREEKRRRLFILKKIIGEDINKLELAIVAKDTFKPSEAYNLWNDIKKKLKKIEIDLSSESSSTEKIITYDEKKYLENFIKIMRNYNNIEKINQIDIDSISSIFKEIRKRL